LKEGLFSWESKEFSWPYNSTSTVSANVSGIPQPTEFTIDTFLLEASGSDFTIIKLETYDNAFVVQPFFEGLYEGKVIQDGDTIEFKLVSPLTDGQIAELVFKFEIAESGDTFRSNVTLRTN
jgi:hypothetical protein